MNIVMNAGKLRHQVILQEKSTSTSAAGELTHTWTTAATVWARISPLRGRELELAQQISPESTTMIEIRYNSGAIANNRIKFGSKIYEINAVLDTDERNIQMKLLCTETGL